MPPRALSIPATLSWSALVILLFMMFSDRAAAPAPAVQEDAEVITLTDEDFVPVMDETEPPIVPIDKATAPEPAEEQPLAAQVVPEENNPNEIFRIEDPYPFPSLSAEALNAAARASLVNIQCTVEGVAQPITGSGVVIDPRGIILTNAHVAQYVLIEEAATNVSCVVRTGAPARPMWRPQVMFVPERWVTEHAKDLRLERPTGTGEHDYALLFASPLDTGAQTTLPALPIDVRDSIAFEGEEVLLASYPAGFLGAQVSQNNLHPATTLTVVNDMYTFSERLVDALSLGGVIVAQGGSSGGAVVNRWGRLVGIIVTTSDGATTAERDLRAITLAHISRSFREHAGISLTDYLGPDVFSHAARFRADELPDLRKQLVDQLVR